MEQLKPYNRAEVAQSEQEAGAKTDLIKKRELAGAETLPRINPVEYERDLTMNVNVELVDIENQARDIALNYLEDEYGFSDLQAEVDDWGVRLDPEVLISQVSDEMKEALLDEREGTAFDTGLGAITEEGEIAEPTEADVYQYLQSKAQIEYQKALRPKKQKLAEKVVENLDLDPDLQKAIAKKLLINGHIGSGGMGSVYSAEHLGLAREEAVKILKKQNNIPIDPEALTRFKKEMVGLASLNHPNVVKIFIGELTNEGAYFSMERIEGQDLLSLIQTGPPLELLSANGKPGILDLGIDAAKGVLALHQNGILHRDLKPANFVLSESGLKVIDFGLIKQVKDAFAEKNEDRMIDLSGRSRATTQYLSPVKLDKDVTEHGVVVGTPTYMSPEQVHGKQLTFQTDAFSFGVMLFEMATNELPFDGNSAVDVMINIASNRVSEKKRALLDGYPKEFSETVMSLLEKDPEVRMNMYTALQKMESLREAMPTIVEEEKEQKFKEKLDERRIELLDASGEEGRRKKAKEALEKMQVRDAYREERRERNNQEKQKAVEAKELLRQEKLEARRKELADVSTKPERKQKAQEALAQMQLNDAKRYSKRKRREKLQSMQTYEAAEEVAPTLPPPLIQNPTQEQLRAKTPQKPNVFKRAWGGIKSLFGRK